MRILVVSRSMPMHNIGGMESVAWDLARAFARRGHETAVMTSAHPDLPVDGVVEAVGFRTVAAPSGRYSPAWWRGSRALFDQAFSGRVDAVLGVSAAANAIVAGHGGSGRPAFFFQAHGTSSGEIVSKLRSGSLKSLVGLPRNLYWGLFKDRIYQSYDGVVSVGEAVHRQMAKAPTRYLLGATPEVLIPNGIDEQAFGFRPQARQALRAQLGLAPDARVLLSFSRLHAQKGVADAIGAFARAWAKAPDLRLVIVGDGPHGPALRAQSTAAGLDPVVSFTGSVPRAAAPDYYALADALVFPTLRVEGAPMNVLEALASGLPVITTPNGAADDLPCRRVPLGDQPALAQAIGEVRPTAAARGSLLPGGYALAQTSARYLDLFAARLGDRGGAAS